MFGNLLNDLIYRLKSKETFVSSLPNNSTTLNSSFITNNILTSLTTFPSTSSNSPIFENQIFLTINEKLPNADIQQHRIPLHGAPTPYSKHRILEKTFSHLVDAIYSFQQLLNLIYKENCSAIEFLVKYRLLANSRTCEKCGAEMSIQIRKSSSDGLQVDFVFSFLHIQLHLLFINFLIII